MKNDALGDLCRAALTVPPAPAIGLRWQQAVEAELYPAAGGEPPAIMTASELARYLRLTPELLEEYLDQIPGFELGGRLLFRRTAVDNWIAGRERTMAFETQRLYLRKA